MVFRFFRERKIQENPLKMMSNLELLYRIMVLVLFPETRYNISRVYPYVYGKLWTRLYEGSTWPGFEPASRRFL
jgi:hypothetical protein